MNVVKATAEGLRQIQSPAQVARRRDLSVSKIFGTKTAPKAQASEKKPAAKKTAAARTTEKKPAAKKTAAKKTTSAKKPAAKTAKADK